MAKAWDSGRVQEKLIKQLDRQEKQVAFQRDRFLRFKLSEIHSRLVQTLLIEKVIETDNPTAISDAILKGLKQAMKSSEFDFKYFIAPIRSLVPRPNPYSLYMTQYIMEVLIKDPNVIEIYGSDDEIYRIVDRVINRGKAQFDRTEEEILNQLARDKSLTPGTRDYEIALDQLLRKRLGEPQK